MTIDFRCFRGTVILGIDRKEQCKRCGRMLGYNGKGYEYSSPLLRFEVCPRCHRVLQRRSLKQFRNRITMETKA